MCCSSFQMKQYEAIGPTDHKPEVSLTDCYSLIEDVSRSDSENFHLLSLKQSNKSVCPSSCVQVHHHTFTCKWIRSSGWFHQHELNSPWNLSPISVSWLYKGVKLLSHVSIFSLCSGPGLLESVQHISSDDKERMCGGHRHKKHVASCFTSNTDQQRGM